MTNPNDDLPEKDVTEKDVTEKDVTEKDVTDQAVKPPSLAPGVVLLILAGVLIVITLIKPDLPQWLTITIAVAAILVVIALLIYAFRVFRDVTRPGGSR